MAEFKSGFSVRGWPDVFPLDAGPQGRPSGRRTRSGYAYEANEIVGFRTACDFQFRIAKTFNKNFRSRLNSISPKPGAVSSAFTPSALTGRRTPVTSFPVGSNEPVPCCNQPFYIYPGNSQTTAGTSSIDQLQRAYGSSTAGTAATVATPVNSLQSIYTGMAANLRQTCFAKIAWDSPTSTAHFEIRGITRFFRSGVALHLMAHRSTPPDDWPDQHPTTATMQGFGATHR